MTQELAIHTYFQRIQDMCKSLLQLVEDFDTNDLREAQEVLEMLVAGLRDILDLSLSYAGTEEIGEALPYLRKWDPSESDYAGICN